ncbi:S26 family signal peptidase [Streptosporangium roseum]|uniref:S26 family signal peptidase n=1 Tax=Streptosporangium roseum TaxID=2001 RepID=UPI0004CD80DF|nr:S26 family signal peptidase [Streptosporangium roseum]
MRSRLHGRLLLLVVLLAASALLVARRLLVVVRVRGTSMVPTLQPGDRVLLRRAPAERLRRGQIVVLEPIGLGGRWGTGPLPDPAAADWLVKRIAAMPGDPVPEEVVDQQGLPAGTVVPPGRLVVLGDGVHSSDSRVWGYVPFDRVLGVMLRALGSMS